MMKIEEGKFYRSRDGRKVGPMVIGDRGPTFLPIYYVKDRTGFWGRDGSFENAHTGAAMLDIVSEWSEGPIRTVTRREIVPGTYGRIKVTGTYQGNRVTMDWDRSDVITAAVPIVGLSAEELREAAHLFNQLAEALEDKP